ncbi:hypothetical protein SDC9_179746 [bioreactor metagenome]|uniref:Uncharacterized protein n=1 Tax=bioreactor metagenome TaxID=1076179 RepID=A0A645GZV4_9ZZZZ
MPVIVAEHGHGGIAVLAVFPLAHGDDAEVAGGLQPHLQPRVNQGGRFDVAAAEKRGGPVGSAQDAPGLFH